MLPQPSNGCRVSHRVPFAKTRHAPILATDPPLIATRTAEAIPERGHAMVEQPIDLRASPARCRLRAEQGQENAVSQASDRRSMAGHRLTRA
ncbi:hypothetical protein [Roseomonas elaeocarpi]|uniref:Uncharacterized protein n=1 Tax=Roseomonas elaeocarpi TaxID=907779 RepID=A0ABV6JX66_9PROT